MLKKAHIVLDLSPLFKRRRTDPGSTPIATGAQSKMYPIVRSEHPLDLEHKSSTFYQKRPSQLEPPKQKG
jgi:hypothetical protein